MIRGLTKTGISHFFSALLVGFVAFGIGDSAMAGTDTANFNINANVNAVGRITGAILKKCGNRK